MTTQTVSVSRPILSDAMLLGTVLCSFVSAAEGLYRIVERGTPILTATRAGNPVNTYDGANYSINTVTSAASAARNTVTSYGANISREFNFAVPNLSLAPKG